MDKMREALGADQLVCLLEYIGQGDAEAIDGDDFEFLGETEEGLSGHYTHSVTDLCLQAAEALKAALASKAESAEPVYQVWYFDGGWRDVSKEVYERESYRDDARILYTAPQPATIPEGWKEELASIQKSITCLLSWPHSDETELSKEDREMMEGCEAGCGALYRLLTGYASPEQPKENTHE